MLENLWANLSDNAKAALTKAGIKFEELKGISAAKFAELSAKAIKEQIIAAVKRFSGLTTQDDDMTVVVIKVK